jgi:hypothetical protein
MQDGIVSLTGNTIFGFYDVRLCKITTGEKSGYDSKMNI